MTQFGTGEFPDKPMIKLKELGENGFHGDTTICFATDVITRYRFPQIEHEKFLVEGYLYDQIDHDGYHYIAYPEILTICEYREDGYTNHIDKISYENPVGRMHHEAQKMQYAVSLKEQMLSAATYNQYKVISRHGDIRVFSFRERIMLWITWPIGFAGAYQKKKRLMKKGEI